MRVIGVLLLGLGITLLIMSAVALVAIGHEGDLAAAVGCLVCAGLVPVPMIIGGIAIIRRVEDDTMHQSEELTPAPAAEEPENPFSRPLARMRTFELNRLNWIGWLLLLATFGFVLGEAGVMVLVLEDGAFEGRVGRRLIGLGMLFLAVGFFTGLRWLLRVLGVSIYRW